MKNLISMAVALLLSASAFAQSSIQLYNGVGGYVVLYAPTSLSTGTLDLDLPDEGGIIVSDGNIDEYAWVLGGNASPTSNRFGTTTNTDLVFVTGASGPNTRMTLTASGALNVGSASQFQVDGSTGNLAKIRNLSYSWPGSHTGGFLRNDGSGNLSWQTSVQADRAGIGTWYDENWNGADGSITVTGTNVFPIVTPFGGSLTGVSISLSAARTAGSCTAIVTKNGNPTSLTVIIDGANTQFNFSAIASGVENFSPGDRIGVNLDGSTSPNFAPNNNDILVTVFAQF